MSLSEKRLWNIILNCRLQGEAPLDKPVTIDANRPPECPQCGEEATYQTPDGTFWDSNAHYWRVSNAKPEKREIQYVTVAGREIAAVFCICPICKTLDLNTEFRPGDDLASLVAICPQGHEWPITREQCEARS